jgi:monoamine oxidase
MTFARREILRLAAGAFALPAAARSAATQPTGIVADDKTIDVAIVGGGISGVYCAWRLQEAHPDWRIVLFEGSADIGGRLPVRPPHMENMVAELGGMRIIWNRQPLITQLINELNKRASPGQQIELYDFPRLSDFTTEPDKVPYRLSFLERGLTAEKIMYNAIERIVPGITTTPGLSESQRREMTQAASFGDQRLYEQGFWNVLLRVLSGEAYQLALDAGGYNSVLANWNAADAIPWYLTDFGDDADKPLFKGFKQGFQQVPKSIAQRFRARGGDVQVDTRMDGFKLVGDVFELCLFVGQTAPTKSMVRAKRLILAMPRRSLDLLTPKSRPLQDQKTQTLIASVTPRPLFKMFTTYASPWWHTAGVESGRSVTDLPVRQIYYWPKQDGEAVTSGRAMLMATYDDGTNIDFWNGLRWDGPRPPALQTWQAGPSAWEQYQASKRMADEVSRQLALVHGLTYTPKVESAAFRDWGADPFGGGWNTWNVDVRSWEVKHEIVQPLSSLRLYICGEAYSDGQGWVEGALQTADMVLERIKLE